MLADLLSLSVLACHCAWVCLVRALHLLGARNYLRAHRFSTDRLPRKEKAAGKSAPGELSVPHPARTHERTHKHQSTNVEGMGALTSCTRITASSGNP